MRNPTFLAGESVALRPLDEPDVEFLQAAVNHPEVRALLGQSFPTTLARERRYVEETDESLDAVQLLITAGEDRVGVVEFDPIDREAGVADIAAWLHPDHRGRGYATEAAELMVGYAFDELRLHKVTASAYDANERSRELLADLGFTEEGVGREDAFFGGEYHDTHYYGVLEGEWRDRDGEPAGSGS